MNTMLMVQLGMRSANCERLYQCVLLLLRHWVVSDPLPLHGLQHAGLPRPPLAPRVCGEAPQRCALFVTPWTVGRQAPLSMGCSRQEYWGGVPCPPPGDLPDPGIKPASYVSCVGKHIPYH